MYSQTNANQKSFAVQFHGTRGGFAQRRIITVYADDTYGAYAAARARIDAEGYSGALILAVKG